MLDARGYSCPEPVIMVRKELQNQPDGCHVMVDNRVAVENITRFAMHQGYEVAVTEQGPDFSLHITKK